MLLDDILTFNQNFVEEKQYLPYETDVFPNKRMVIFTCMDSRLLELLPKALNLKNGDTKIVKNAGAILNDHYDSIMKSLLVAVYALKADEILVIGHRSCGMHNFSKEKIVEQMDSRGVRETALQEIEKDGIDLDQWLSGFSSVEESVENSVDVIRTHPLLPNDVPVHGLVIDPATGKLDLVKNGY
ncbi:beta-class carbonic anhydrase [Radiobacillus sp. PE A8.2]|uniref:beta-class carbonic anhydrase n=1 Tax=Radiobacillus sp. PE A8.2 TaxID=3380349 RepID=UPI00388FE106